MEGGVAGFDSDRTLSASRFPLLTKRSPTRYDPLGLSRPQAIAGSVESAAFGDQANHRFAHPIPIVKPLAPRHWCHVTVLVHRFVGDEP